MKKSRFTEEQIVGILKEQEVGVAGKRPMKAACRVVGSQISVRF